ncbi:MAG: hypothetical protein KF816_06275 [Melioribacteraceae bacterium]|nr:hypothetical protein [Melioribacteraceae bacterium]
MKRKTIVGELINFRGMVWAPVNEQGVVFLFGKIAHELGMYVEVVRPGYPDCIAKRYIGKGRWQEVRIEFEFKSSHFETHKHSKEECDIIICWSHDWSNCPKHIEVIELHEEIKKLENFPLAPPDQITPESEYSLESHFSRSNAFVKEIFKKIDIAIKKTDDSIYYKVAKYRLMYYSPKRVFAAVALRKDFINIHLFTNGKKIKGVESFSGEYGYKWGRIYIRSKEDVQIAIGALIKSRKMIEECVSKNITTGWYAEKDE